jgi:tetratricopeptide (TPR) repeat protein
MLGSLKALLLIVAALAITADAAQPPQTGKTWAVVVGISRYPKLPGGQQLQFADRDAALFAESIQKRGVGTYNIRVLTGPDATVSGIKSAVGTWLARSAAESDTVIFFFSGHGLFERDFGEAYLLGYDSDPRDPFATALAVSELRHALGSRVRAGHVLVIADALRRDFFDPESEAASSRLFVQAFEQLSSARRGVSAIVASGPGEFSREGARWGGHGVFTKHLADVISEAPDRNGDGLLTADEMFDALAARVSDDTSGKQHLWKSGTGFDRLAIARLETQPIATSVAPTPGSANKQSDKTVTSAPIQKAEQGVASPANPPQPPRSTTEEKTRPAAMNSNPQPRPAPPEKRGDAGEPVAAKDRPATETETKKQGSDAPSRVALSETSKASKPVEAPTAAPSTAVKPKASEARKPGPPAAESVQAPPAEPPRAEPARSEVALAEIPSPPKPTVNPPAAVSVSADRVGAQPTLATSVPEVRPPSAPSPLVLQLEAAIATRNLIEPRNASAWDFYQRLASEPAASADLARLKPRLAAAMTEQGRAIVAGDVRGDNISDRVDDFKRAGQLFARARTLAPEGGDLIAFEKLSAASALIALQFYDEAERALAQIQGAKLAAVENGLGLVHQGKLDSFRAERAFKRAIELDAKWAAPHYNLALLYRSQQKPESLAEFEAAAALEPENVSLVAALGEEYFTRQQFKQAADAFRKAIALKPGDDTLHTKLGHALFSQGLQDEANREYQKARELRGKHP